MKMSIGIRIFLMVCLGVIKLNIVYSQGQVLAFGDNTYGQCSVPTGLTNVVAISAGNRHSMAVKSDGTVVAWGDNTYGQCNVPAGLTNVVAISAGVYHSVALKNDGTVVAWGRDNRGQCDVPSNLSNVVSISAGFYTTAALTKSGSVIDWGYFLELLKYPFPAGLNGAVAIAENSSSAAYAITNHTGVVGWGSGDSGQIANLPNNLSGAVAITAGSYFGTVLLTNSTVVQFGADFNGDTETPSLSGVVAVSSGGFSTMALMNDGSVVIWPESGGFGYFNGVTYGSMPSDFFNSFGPVVSVSTGNAHYLALLGIPPEITSQPASQSVLSGNNVMFNVIANGTTNLVYQWQMNGVQLSGANQNTYSITNATINNAGLYTVVITNNYGAITSSIASLAVWLPQTTLNIGQINGNQIQILLAGTPSLSYLIQAASNLVAPVNWQPVFTNTTDSNGNMVFTDSDAAAYPARFYRAINP
jgi:hypothetical protein